MSTTKNKFTFRYPSILPILVLVVGVMSASTGAIFVRYAQNDSVQPLVIAFYRLLFATIFLVPWILTKYRSDFAKISNKDYVYIGLTGFFLSLHFAAWISSLRLTSIASSVVLVTTTPIWVVLVSNFFLREKISRGVIIGMIVSLIGGLIVSLAENCRISFEEFSCTNQTEIASTIPLGNLLAVLGAMMAAGYLMMGRNLRQNIPLVPYAFLVYGIAAIFILMYGMISAPNSFAEVSPSAYVWLILLAIFPQTLGHSSLNYALGHLSPVYVSIALLGEPIASTILGILLFREIPTLIKIIGAVLILTGLGLVIVLKKDTQLITDD